MNTVTCTDYSGTSRKPPTSVMMVAGLAMLLGVMQPVSAEKKLVSGTSWKVVDGDTIHLEGHKIRLIGIDAPEKNQHCTSSDGLAFSCGLVARDILLGLLLMADGPVQCRLDGKDRYRRWLGRCYAGKAGEAIDVQRMLVVSGYAVAEYADDYRQHEHQARQHRRGLWAGEFERPQQFRRSKRS